MKAKMKMRSDWERLLSFYAEQNHGRATRLGVFEKAGNTANDYWLEDGMPLAGITVDSKDVFPTVELSIGTFAHMIRNVKNLKVLLSAEGDEDGIDLTNTEGTTTVAPL